MTVISALAVSFCLSCWAVAADAYERGRPWRSDQPWEEFSANFGLYLTTFNSDVTLAGTRGRSRPEYRGPPRPGYTFSFWNDDRVDLGAGLGFLVMDIGAGIKAFAEGSVGGQEGSSASEVSEEATTRLFPCSC